PEALAPAPPVDAPLLDQPQIELVHERRGLQRVIAALAPQGRGGQPSKLRIDQWEQPVTSFQVPVAPVREQLGDLLRRVCHGEARWACYRLPVSPDKAISRDVRVTAGVPRA